MPHPASGLRAVDRWFALFNILAALAWLPYVAHPVARWGVGVHLLAAGLPLLLARAPRLSAPVAFFREVYPLVFVGIFWGLLGLRYGLIDTTSHDRFVAGLDALVFRGHPNLTWIVAMPYPMLVETMEAFYFAYYLLLVGVPLLLLLRGDRMGMRELMLRVAVTYFTCFLFYMVFPVVGPLEMFPRFDGVPMDGFFHRLNNGLRDGGDSLGTAFPSSHVAGAVTFAWVAWRRLPRPLGMAAVGITAMMTLATVYTQHHFAIDALVGAVAAVALQVLVVPMLGCPSTGGARSRHEAARGELASMSS